MDGVFGKFILTAFGILLCFIIASDPAEARRGPGQTLPPVAAAADNASPLPTNAPAAGDNLSVQANGKVGAGVGICNIDATNVDFGLVPGISETLISIPGHIHISCGGFTTSTKFCIMFYPTDPNEINYVGNSRILYGPAVNGAIPYLYFNGYMDNALWGAGVTAGGGERDYGTPYISSTGFYVGSGFDLTPEWRLDLRSNPAINREVGAGVYTNNYYIKMNYTNSVVGGSADSLCDVSRKPGLIVNTSTVAVKFTANVKSACDMITGGALAFGQQISLRNPLSATSTLTVKCSGGMDYTVSANAGNNPDADFTNAMKCATPDSCGASTIQYLLYDDAGNIWNSQRAGGYVQKGSMSSMGSDVYNLTAKTIPVDITPPPGAYKDTIIFTLTSTPNQYSLSRRR